MGGASDDGDDDEDAKDDIEKIRTLFFEQNKSEKEIADQLGLDEIYVLEVTMILEMERDDAESGDQNQIDHSTVKKSDSNNGSDGPEVDDSDNSEFNTYRINGLGRELFFWDNN